MGLDMKTRRKITDQIARRYQKASRKQKSQMLDEFVSLSGYHRKYASHLLSQWGKTRLVRIDGQLVRLKAGNRRGAGAVERRGRKRIYDESVVEALKSLWELYDRMCGKRLVVAMRPILRSPELVEELEIGQEVRQKLLGISAATIDRLLQSERKKVCLKGTSHTTRATGAIAARIPVRTFAEQPASPGFFQADLVGHDGGVARGDFCYTLNATDPATGWCEPRAVLNKAGKWTTEALDWIYTHCPLPIRGWHTDGGTEFLNAHMERYCSKQGIEFTRSRYYRKNDNCYVEQKNDTLIRRNVGYLRYHSEQHCALLNELYDALRLLANYFYPSMKLIQKHRVGSRLTKRYDEPKTPYQRVMVSQEVGEQVKQNVRSKLEGLNPIELRCTVDELAARLIDLVQHPDQDEGRGR